MPAYKDKKTSKWYVQCYYTDWTGKRKHKVKRGFDRKKDAEQWEREFLGSEQSKPLTMNALIDAFISYKENQCRLGNIKESTLFHYKIAIKNHIRPYFGEALVENVKAYHISEFLEKTAKKDGKKSASSSINLWRTVLGMIFKFGMRDFGLKENPVAVTETVKKYSHDERAPYWTLEQYSAFVSALKKYNYHPQFKIIYNLMYFAGLRVNEVLALTLNDVEPYRIYVKKNLMRINQERKVSTPKTESSSRTVEILPMLYYQIVNYADALMMYRSDEPLFTVKDFTVRYHLNKLWKLEGLPKASPHTFRHSYATISYAMTKDILAVANQLGHKNASMTFEFYAKLMQDNRRDNINAIEKLLENMPKNIF